VNSRVFEAIAAGALPVTNSERGLDALGLGDVPTYSSAEELNPLVDRLLGDADGTQALVDKLGGVVRERHSFEARAEDLARIIEAIA
jgi:spore maturation protein CgeB